MLFTLRESLVQGSSACTAHTGNKTPVKRGGVTPIPALNEVRVTCAFQMLLSR